MEPSEYGRDGLRNGWGIAALPGRSFTAFRMTAVFQQDDSNVHLPAMPSHEAMMSYERGGMERNEGRNERSGVQDKRAARTQEGGGKSVTNCGVKRSTRRAMQLQQCLKSS